MKIERLYIDGFGHFADKTIGPFDSPITIFDGQNEAGKSTILSFIRTVLFGFPTTRRSEYYPPLNGGRHGGHIVVLDEDETRYTVERYTGARGGPVSVKDDNGTISPENKLGQLVGHSTKGLFEKVFAFGLDELQEMRSLDEAEVQGRIYSAGLGVKDLTQANNDLEGFRNKIFRPGGNFGATQAVSPLLSELDSVQEQISSHLQDAPRFAELNVRIQQISDEILAVGKTREDCNRTLDHQRSLLSGRDDLIGIAILETKLSTMTQLPEFPQDGISRLENLTEQIAQLGVDVQQQLDTVQKLEETVNRPLDGSPLLEDASDIRKCISERQRLYSAVEDLPERTGEVIQQETEVERLLTELGPGWDIPLVEALDISLPIRDRVTQQKDQNVLLNQALASRLNDKESAEREEQTAKASTERAEAQVKQAGSLDFDDSTLANRRSAINGARDGLGRRSELLRQLDDIQHRNRNKIDTTTKLSVFCAGIISGSLGIGVTAWSLVSNSGLFTLAIGLITLGLGIVLGVIGLRIGQTQGRTAHVEEVQSQIAGLEALLEQAKVVLVLDNIDFSTLQTADAKLESDTRLWSEHQNLIVVHQGAVQELNRRSQDLKLAVSGVEKEEQDIANTQNEWRGWLTDHLLADSFSPDGVLELFSKLETARISVGQQRDRQNRVTAVQRIIDEVGAIIITLAQKHGVTVNGEQPSSLIPAIDGLSQLFDTAQKEQQERNTQQLSLAEKLDELTQDKRRLESLEDQLGTLLIQVNTKDPEEFRRLAALNKEYQDCQKSLENYKATVIHVFGADANHIVLLDELGEQSSETLNGHILDTQQLLEDLEVKRDELNNELTLSQRELEDLSSSTSASDLIAKREMLHEELREQAGEWSKYSLALSILQLARNHHEKERQPQVVQTASDFFKVVTADEYSGLRAPIGQSSIIAVTKSGEEKHPAQLSRGTREQMYLALRFGLVNEFNQHMASLPIIVDDVLVNSDPIRAEALVTQFVSLATTNQVFVFTCHPALVRQFTDAYPDAQHYQL